MKPITLMEIYPLVRPLQQFSDCYLTSSVGALAGSKQGRKVLMQNISHVENGFNIRFPNVNSQQENYFIREDEIEDLVLLDEFENVVFPRDEQNPIIKALEIAMGKLIQKHPTKKPFICRLADCQEPFEFNKPSNFLEMFTGRKPISLNEHTIFRMNLKKEKDQAVELFEKIDKAKEFSFVAGSGLGNLKYQMPDAHCYIVEGVNSENKYLELFDCRGHFDFKLSFDQAIKCLKYLTGYLD